MARQEEEWALGLQPLVRNRDLNCLLSFNTLFTSSPNSSSDIDNQSTGSFFHDKGITFGSLIGVSSIVELSKRSTRGRIAEPTRNKKSCKSKSWFLSLCSKLSSDSVCNNSTPSLRQFLEVERRTASFYRRYPNL
ncbi:hypothetical protein Adt_29986 [Abeliophyllum distichum]|uniref:Uncharacterized protein n=1 Tax=Abeliophyllum distichum TaxID=126358 RepID=A0ABD1RA06_9LAMI